MHFVKIYVLSLYLLGVPVISRVFNFRKLCNVVLHDAKSKTSAVICDGNAHSQKDLIFDARSIASLSSMEMFNFNMLSFESTAKVSRLAIRNTTTVVVPVNFQGLNELRVESVTELTLQDIRNQDSSTGNWTKTETVFLHQIKKLNLISTHALLWPVDSLTITQVDSLNLLSDLAFDGNYISIGKSKINLEDSTVVLNFTAVDIKNSVLYIHKGGQLNLTSSNHILVSNTNLHLEDGSVTLLKCEKANLEDNLFYGLTHKTFKVIKSIDVAFIENGFFLSPITDVLILANRNVKFFYNSFDCSYCSRNRNLLGVSLNEIGDRNHCYADCNVSLNQFQNLLQKEICDDPNQFIVEGKLCPSKVSMIMTVSLVVTFIVTFIIVTCVVVHSHIRRKEYCDIDQNARNKVIEVGNSLHGNSRERTTTNSSINSHLYEEVRANETYL